MPSGRPPKATIYTLPHGIEVVGEYAPTNKNPYWRVRVRPHRLLGAVENSGGLYVRKSRVVMTAKLGRMLSPTELVHHADENKHNDAPENLELTTTAEHNAHHKTGAMHTQEARSKISAGLTSAYREGRRS